MSLSEKKFLGLKPVAISQEDTKLLNEVMNSKLGTMQKRQKNQKNNRWIVLRYLWWNSNSDCNL